MADKKEFRVQAKQRDGRGKNDARRARREGMVPITIYGGGAETVAAVAPLRDLAMISPYKLSAIRFIVDSQLLIAESNRQLAIDNRQSFSDR